MKLSIAAAAFISFTSFCLVHPATINVNPPDVPSGGGLNVQCTSQRDNVLKYAIDNASPGDTLILAPGLYYLACPTKIDKPLTILGACADWLASTDPNFNATSQVRPGCNATGETVIMASSRYGDSNGALQGIWINSNDVTVKGLSFYEDNEKFRGMFNILSDMPTGTYSNIEIINNYFNGEKATSTYHIGGNTPDKWPKTFVNLTFQGNFIKANSPSMWEPLSFRGAGFDTDPSKHATLVNFHLIGNTIAKSTLTDAVVNFHRTNNIL